MKICKRRITFICAFRARLVSDVWFLFCFFLFGNGNEFSKLVGKKIGVSDTNILIKDTEIWYAGDTIVYANSIGSLTLENNEFYSGITLSGIAVLELWYISSISLIDTLMSYNSKTGWFYGLTNIYISNSYIVGSEEAGIEMFDPVYVTIDDSYFYDNNNEDNGMSTHVL